jgi:hypothetical protein
VRLDVVDGPATAAAAAAALAAATADELSTGVDADTPILPPLPLLLVLSLLPLLLLLLAQVSVAAAAARCSCCLTTEILLLVDRGLRGANVVGRDLKQLREANVKDVVGVCNDRIDDEIDLWHGEQVLRRCDLVGGRMQERRSENDGEIGGGHLIDGGERVHIGEKLDEIAKHGVALERQLGHGGAQLTRTQRLVIDVGEAKNELKHLERNQRIRQLANVLLENVGAGVDVIGDEHGDVELAARRHCADLVTERLHRIGLSRNAKNARLREMFRTQQIAQRLNDKRHRGDAPQLALALNRTPQGHTEQLSGVVGIVRVLRDQIAVLRHEGEAGVAAVQHGGAAIGRRGATRLFALLEIVFGAISNLQGVAAHDAVDVERTTALAELGRGRRQARARGDERVTNVVGAICRVFSCAARRALAQHDDERLCQRERRWQLHLFEHGWTFFRLVLGVGMEG